MLCRYAVTLWHKWFEIVWHSWMIMAGTVVNEPVSLCRVCSYKVPQKDIIWVIVLDVRVARQPQLWHLEK